MNFWSIWSKIRYLKRDTLFEAKYSCDLKQNLLSEMKFSIWNIIFRPNRKSSFGSVFFVRFQTKYVILIEIRDPMRNIHAIWSEIKSYAPPPTAVALPSAHTAAQFLIFSFTPASEALVYFIPVSVINQCRLLQICSLLLYFVKLKCVYCIVFHVFQLQWLYYNYHLRSRKKYEKSEKI